ncbi:MAG: F0F1 ATP synthase subunit B' [Hypericibacter sp.]
MRIGLTRKIQLLAALALGLVAAVPALAAEGEKAGLPQLDPAVFSPQLIWLVITFVLLYLLMSRLALPRIASVLATRQQKIEGDLARAERVKAEAEKVLADYEKAMTDARVKAQALTGQAAADVAAELAKREAAFGVELNARTAEAEKRINATKDAALADIRSVAAELTQSIVRKVAGVELSPSAAKEWVEAAVRERR